ncbi:hypothetical protein [Aurantiacibacter spongiae]|uniref:hypothetical protein n=1 Tax=Aurantiacibacter spongiae TaxID=2488860 RepID=UPI0015F2D54E|nr:hypothetical protein [Aurantiacibacter spongiae]
MAVAGCLLLLVLPIAGGVLGLWLLGPDAMAWGAAIGFGVAVVACALPALALWRAGRRD